MHLAALPQRLELVGQQIARDVDVALLQKQPLACWLLDVPPHQPRQLRRALPVAVEAAHDDAVVRHHLVKLEGAAASRVRLQPFAAPVAIDFVFLRERAVHDGEIAAAQHVQHEGGRIALVERHLEGVLIDGTQHILIVVRRDAQVLDQEGRPLVQRSQAREGVDDVFSREGVAGMEGHSLAQLEGKGRAVLADLPGFG